MRLYTTALCAILAACACQAHEALDAVNATAIAATMPADGTSAVVSPYSSAFVTGLLADGSDSSDLRIALSEKLGLRTTDFAPTLSRIRLQLADWAASNRVGVLFANSMWLRNYTRLERDFHAMANRDYAFTFGPLLDVEAMNAWTSVKTDGYVPKAVDSFDASCSSVLISAAAFNGAWDRSFPPATNGVFHAADGDVALPFMKDVRKVRMVRHSGYVAFALPYRGACLRLYVVVPEDASRLASLATLLSPEEMSILDRALIPGYHPEDSRGDPLPDVEGASEAMARISLPKFRIATAADGMPALAAAGLGDAGYNAICKDLRIGKFVQHAVFETSETGGEVGIAKTAAEATDGEIVDIPCDRPFAFVLRTDTRLTLLAGRFTGKSTSK